MTADQLTRGVYEGHDGIFRHLRDLSQKANWGFCVPVTGGTGRRVSLDRFARWARRRLSDGFAKAFLAEMDRMAGG